jgi:hypothetical protein
LAKTGATIAGAGIARHRSWGRGGLLRPRLRRHQFLHRHVPPRFRHHPNPILRRFKVTRGAWPGWRHCPILAKLAQPTRSRRRARFGALSLRLAVIPPHAPLLSSVLKRLSNSSISWGNVGQSPMSSRSFFPTDLTQSLLSIPSPVRHNTVPSFDHDLPSRDEAPALRVRGSSRSTSSHAHS